MSALSKNKDVLKSEIKKRLFKANVSKNDSRALHGWMWFRRCCGEGEVCNEYTKDDSVCAVFESCQVCGSDAVVPFVE